MACAPKRRRSDRLMAAAHKVYRWTGLILLASMVVYCAAR